MRKKKLLVFASTFPRWREDTNPPFVYELSKRLTNDFDVSVLAPSYPGAKDFEVMDKMKVNRFHYFFKKYEKLAGSGGILPTLKKNFLFYFQVPFFLLGEYIALRKAVKEIKPDIIHAHWIIPQGWIASKIKKKFGVPYVVTSHGSDIMGLKGFTNIKKSTLNNAKKITVVSNAIKKEILTKIDSSLKNKINVIPMGVDTKLFNPNKKDNSLKRKYQIKGPFLLFVGRLAPEKGIDLLIEAMPKVLKKVSTAKLMIIGRGTLEKELKQKVKDLDIQESIIFLGALRNNQLPKYYATADIFVCPSRREGSPVSYIESLACGTPIVVGDLPVSREIVGKDRGIITNQNPEEITAKIIKVMNNKFGRIRLRDFLIKSFDKEILKKKFIEVLR